MIKHWTVYKQNPVTGAFEFKKRVETYNQGLDFIAEDCKATADEVSEVASWQPDGSYEVKTPVKRYQLVPTKVKD